MKTSMKFAAVCALSVSLIACGSGTQKTASVDTTLPEEKELTNQEATPPLKDIATSCHGFWGRFGDPDTEVGLSIEVKTNGTFEILYSDYGTSSGMYTGDRDKIEMIDREDQSIFQLADCASGAPSFAIPADEYSDKKRFTLKRFAGDYWSEAEKRGIPIATEGGE